MDIPLDDRQLSDSSLQVGQGTVASVIDVPHGPPLHRLAGEVLHLKVQLQDLQGSLALPARPGMRVGEPSSAAFMGMCLFGVAALLSLWSLPNPTRVTQPQNPSSDFQRLTPTSAVKVHLSPWRLATQPPGAYSAEVELTREVKVCPGPGPHPQWLLNDLPQLAALKSHATGHFGTWCLRESHPSWLSPWNTNEKKSQRSGFDPKLAHLVTSPRLELSERSDLNLGFTLNIGVISSLKLKLWNCHPSVLSPAKPLLCLFIH